MGCRYCMLACPFNIPKFEWFSNNPRIRKCTFCSDRQGSSYSEVGAGVCVLLYTTVLGNELEKDVLKELAAGIPYLLGLYLLVKFLDLAFAGEIGVLFEGSTFTTMFWIEILLPAVALLLFMMKSMRENPNAVFGGACLVVVGVVVNRFNVALVGMPDIFDGRTYFPTWQEFAVTLGIVSGGVIAFGYVAKYFNVFGEARA